MKSGMIAAESIYERIKTGQHLENVELTEYEKNVRSSWIMKEL